MTHRPSDRERLAYVFALIGVAMLTPPAIGCISFLIGYLGVL